MQGGGGELGRGTLAVMYRPNDLPEIDGVDVIGLRGSDPPRVAEYMRHVDRCAWVRLDGDAAGAVADLWRQLPVGEAMRCHVPPFGLRFWRAGVVVVEASICWSCNNVYGYQDGVPVAFEFDGQSQAAQALLTTLREAMRDGLDYR